jgi:predicted lipoprotein with Yx(FWY)xxD motif
MRIVTMLLGATAALATLTACGGGGAEQTAGSPTGTNSAVSVRDIDGVGQALVDSAGKTLYFADQEADGTIKCTESCLAFWFPVEGTDSTAKAMDGLAVVKRSDNGVSQLTFEGKPLYTFKLDTGPGQSKGNNLEDAFGSTTFTWRAATTAAAATQAPPSSGTDYGY